MARSITAHPDALTGEVVDFACRPSLIQLFEKLALDVTRSAKSLGT